jgi:hypothetical protein
MLSWLVIIALVVLLFRTRERVAALETRSNQLNDLVNALRKRVNEQTSVAAPAAVHKPVAPAPVVAAPTEPVAAPPVAPPPYSYPPIESRPSVIAASVVAPPPTIPVASTGDEIDDQLAASTKAEIPAFTPPVSPPGEAPPAPPRPPRPAAAAIPPAPPSEPFDWEQLIGVKLFSWIAGAALALGAVFFLRYSVQQGWLRPEIRMGLGLATGIGLLIACEMKAARNYSQTANALDASGIAILFASVYASFALWHLLPALVAFGLLFLVTGVAVLLSIRRQSMFIAVLGLLGGFATPAMLSSGQDNPIGLFSYLLLLNVGLAWVAYRQRWPALTALSLVFTTVYQWAWVMKFLNADKLSLAVGIFLVFPVASLIAFAVGRSRGDHDDGSAQKNAVFENVVHASAVLPLVFSLYLATVPAYGAHFGLLFGLTFVLAAGMFALAITIGPLALHFLGALSVVGVFGIWMRSSYTPDAWPWLLAFVAAFAGLYLLAPSIAARTRDAALDGLARFAAYAAPLLALVLPALLVLEPRAGASPLLTFGVLFALVASCAAYAIARHEGAVHFIAAFFAIIAEAVWSSRYLNAGSLYTALALYGVFGLFYVGTPALARRYKRPVEPNGAGGVLTLASLALLLFIAGGSIAASALWGMALLIAVLNAGLLSEAAHSRTPALSIAGAVLSWIILGVWWITVGTAAVLLPAMMVMGGFGVLTLIGNTWARGRAVDDETVAGFDRGMYVGLIGHVFIAFLVTRPELSIPPWPIFGVLGALQVAVLGASTYRRSGWLQMASVVATTLILALWTTTAARVAPWPQVAIYGSSVVALLAFIGLPLARRVGAPEHEFELSAALSVLLGQVIVIFAQLQTGAPDLGFLVGAQMLFVIGAFALAWIDVENVGWVSVASVIPALAGAASWGSWHDKPADWQSQMFYAAPMYLAFVSHPLLLGRRAGKARAPFVAAVLASALFFFIARHTLVLGGYDYMIGALPVTEAILLAPVVALLVKIERERLAILRKSGEAIGIATDRLVLVAGAVLAFITAAIPLQLEKNWITIAWALEGVALLWLCRRLTHRALITSAIALFAAVFIRLTLNPAVLSYHPRGAYPILNWYLYTYLVCAVAMFAAARLVKVPESIAGRLVGGFTAAGTVLLFLLVNIEIADYYSTGSTITFNFSSSLAQDLTYTIGWAAFALAMLSVGIVKRNRANRIASIILLVVTVLKCFLHDLGRLGGLYRVGSFVGLAISLALVALALQKFVLAKQEPAGARAGATLAS